MSFICKKIVVRNIGFRAVAFLFFVISVIAAQSWQKQPNKISTRFLVQLQPEPETIMQNRMLFDYVLGGRSPDCFNNYEIEARNCEAARNKSREFVLKHWQLKKRAYITVEYNNIDSFREKHIFVEPDTSGVWHIVFREEFSSLQRGFAGTINQQTARDVKRRIAGEDQRHKFGAS